MGVAGGGRLGPAPAGIPQSALGSARRPVMRPRARPTGLPLDWMIGGLVLLAIVLIWAVPTTLLTHWKIQYATSGGSFYEKLHPATYVVILAFGLLLLRGTDPIGALNRMFSDAKLTLIFLLCWSLMLVHTFVLGRPFTGIIDTFLLPLLFCLVLWQLSPDQRKPLVWAVHLLMFVNISLAYYEYVSGRRLIPLTLGNVLITSDWRSAGLLGHPLSAAGLVGAYVLALLVRPDVMGSPTLRVLALFYSLGSLMAFGGRTTLVVVLLVLALIAGRAGFRLIRGARIPLPVVLATMCMAFLVVAGIVALLDAGAFDKMLLRFSSDKGSAWARVASVNLLGQFDWGELVLGPDPIRATALQSMMGLDFGIENFWIACIVQYGIVHTTLITIGLACLFAEVLRRSQPAAGVLVLFIIVIALSSVSFSSKDTKLAGHVILIVLLLSREGFSTTDRIAPRAVATAGFGVPRARASRLV
jgi:hypothetical protein